MGGDADDGAVGVVHEAVAGGGEGELEGEFPVLIEIVESRKNGHGSGMIRCFVPAVVGRRDIERGSSSPCGRRYQ